MNELRKAESNLQSTAPGFLSRVRDAATKLGVRGTGPDLVRDSLRDVEDLVHIDADVSTYASQRGGKAIKSLIKRSIQWYLRYIAVQVNALGEALVSFGTVVADRLDDVEGATRDLQQTLDALEGRVRRLEASDEKPE